MAKIYFEDLTEGIQLSCQPVVLTREEMIDFAMKYDPQPFHIDESAAEHSIFGGLIASSLHTLSTCTRAVVDALGDTAVLTGTGIEEVHLYHPVKPDDILTVHAVWKDLHLSNEKPDRGYATLHCQVKNQKGEPVVSYGYHYLIACRNHHLFR